ncbi:putative GOLD domain-containing protein [Helianthus annuus]|nr:putative GOLD domain-containing protein [Helianthus annuus]
MASTNGLVPITRAFLSSYYDNYPFPPLSPDVSRLTDHLYNISKLLHQPQSSSPLPQGERLLMQEAESEPPHKMDENMWKNREQIEEIMLLLQTSHWPKSLQQLSTPQDVELARLLSQLRDKFEGALKVVESFQAKNSNNIFNTVMTYMPQDFRGTLIRQQRERSERNKQAEVDALVNSGGSIRDRYALLWKQQMDRRRTLSQLGSATGVYKTLVKYLVGVPQVLLDFIRQINDDHGPMEEQRQRYGPPLYALIKMVLTIRLFLSSSWWRFEDIKMQKDQISVLEEAVQVYVSELERFLNFIGEVFANSPFFVTAEEAGAFKNNGYSETTVGAGKTHEVSLNVEMVNSYIAWDFSILQGKISTDIGFCVEHIDTSGNKTLILPYRRYESDQGNFCTVMAGHYRLLWDNSYSTFFKKALRYKVDCIPPVVEPEPSSTAEAE